MTSYLIALIFYLIYQSLLYLFIHLFIDWLIGWSEMAFHKPPTLQKDRKRMQ